MIHHVPKTTFNDIRDRQPRAGDWLYEAVSCVDYVDAQNIVYEVRACHSLSDAAVVAMDHDLYEGGKVNIYWFDVFHDSNWRLQTTAAASEVLQDSALEGV